MRNNTNSTNLGYYVFVYGVYANDMWFWWSRITPLSCYQHDQDCKRMVVFIKINQFQRPSRSSDRPAKFLRAGRVPASNQRSNPSLIQLQAAVLESTQISSEKHPFFCGQHDNYFVEKVTIGTQQTVVGARSRLKFLLKSSTPDKNKYFVKNLTIGTYDTVNICQILFHNTIVNNIEQKYNRK